MDISIFSNLPEDVIINHIMPFAYRTQNKLLLRDIRSFHKDLNECKVYYHWTSLLFNLLYYTNAMKCSSVVKTESVFKRAYLLKDKTDSEIDMFRNNYHNNYNHDTKRRVRLLFGLLSTSERATFYNNYVLLNFEDMGFHSAAI